MNPVDILKDTCRPGSLLYEVLMRHGEQVARKSLDIAESVSSVPLDRNFIYEAALLHDIGVCKTNAPLIGCYGRAPYICHGILGRHMLDNLGLTAHGLVSERHTGAGLTAENIKNNHLPLPCRDMVPVTIEEKIICFADKFFSKKPGSDTREKSFDEVLYGLEKLDKGHAMRFLLFCDELAYTQ
ncbi:MAG: HD domain-containing protein [Thermodesulfobacteriota bacterium]|nr:HD domain-containing protein [Thermodesulfobacteriota bacterium]